jgi:hypothetical protein
VFYSHLINSLHLTLKGKQMPTLEEYQKQVVSLESLGITALTEEDLATAPLEGLDFGAGSFIAHWSVGRYYYLQTKEDYLLHNQDADADSRVPTPDIPPRKPQETFHIFYRQKDVAARANTLLNGDDAYSPRYCWVFTAPAATVKNSPDVQKIIEGFGETLCFWTRIEALEKGHTRNQYGNRKSRHEYNFISLPSAVAAMAVVQGYEVPEYDLSPLTAPGADDSFDDEFFATHMGPSDGDYAGTFYDKQRRAVWKALGEDDPKKASMKGSFYIDKNGKRRKDSLATESEKLSNCLLVAQKDTTLWMRLVLVPNPGGAGFSVPALTEIFLNEEHATLVGQSEINREGGSNESGQSQATHPSLAGWAGSRPEEVIAYLRENGILPLPAGATESVAPPKKDEQRAMRYDLAKRAFLCTDEENPTDEDWDRLAAWAQYAEENG